VSPSELPRFPIKRRTLAAILRDVGIDVEEFRRLLSA